MTKHKDAKYLMVVGAQKTGTSTIIGALNCNPKIFVSHEWFVEKKINKHGIMLFQTYQVPERERIKKRKSIKGVIKRMNGILTKNGFHYDYVGDKWPILGNRLALDNRINELKEVYSIFAIRDLRTWLCHDIVSSIYGCKDDVSEAMYEYCYYFLKSFELTNCVRIRMEDLILKPDDTVKKLAKFLGTEFKPMLTWWEKIDKQKDVNKNIHKWWIRHRSSTLPPIELDISPTFKEHELWDTILPIFDKYYNNIDFKVNIEELNKDLKQISTMWENGKFKGVSLEDLYQSYKKRNKFTV